MKALEQLILSKSRPVQKEAKHFGVSELDKLIMEALLRDAQLGDYPEEQAAAIQNVLTLLKKKFPNIALKETDSNTATVVLHNTGGEKARGEAVALLADTLEGFEEDKKKSSWYHGNPSLPKIGFRYKGLTFLLKKGDAKDKTAFSSTKFEGNLIEAIRQTNGISPPVPEKNKNPDQPYTLVAIENIEAVGLNKDVTEVDFVKKGELTEVYRNHGVTQKTSKADIHINRAGVSVKKYEASQMMSAQGPEYAAVLDVAGIQLGDGKATLDPQTLNNIKKLMVPERLGAKAGVEGKGEEGQEITNFAKTMDVQLGYKLGAPLEADIEKAMELSDEEKTLSSKEQKELKKQRKKEFLKGHSPLTQDEASVVATQIADKVLDTADKQLNDLLQTSVLQDSKFQELVLVEAVTGRGKFVSNEPVAFEMLKWSVESPKRAKYYKDILEKDKKSYNRSYFQTLRGESKFGFRSRGSGTGGWRGWSVRFDRIGKVDESIQLLTEGEQALLFESVDLIVEGAIGDLFTQAITKAKEYGQILVDKIQQAYTFIKDKVKNILSMIYNKLIQLIQKGLSYLLRFLGLWDNSSVLEIGITAEG